MAAKRTFEWRQLRVAGLVVVGVLLLIYGIYKVGKIFDVFADRYTLVTLVPSVAGLREGAPVTVAGQRVGQVSAIDFIPPERKTDSLNVRVDLAISEEAKPQIRGDSRVFIRPQGLLGDKYIDISPGTAARPQLEEGDTLRTEPTIDIEQFLGRSGAILDSASRAVTDLRMLTAGLLRGEGTMGRLLRDDRLYAQMIDATAALEGTLRQLNDPRGTMGRVIHDPTLYNRLLGAVTRVDSLSAAIAAGKGTLGKLIQNDSLYRSLYGGVARADSAIANFSGFMNRMTQGNGTIQRLATDPRMYDELLKAVVDLQTLLAEVRQNPRKFVPPVQVKVF